MPVIETAIALKLLAGALMGIGLSVVVVKILTWTRVLDWFRGRTALKHADANNIAFAIKQAQKDGKVGYVQGIYDLQFAPNPPHGVCPPADFTPDQLAEVVTAYADTHEDGPAPPAVGQAIVRFFPCTEQHK